MDCWGKRARRKEGERLPATLARLLMQLQGSSQVSPQSALRGAEAAVCFAGVAQLVEHLFCKQVVRGSSPRASSAVGPRVMASGGHARGSRVLASFSLRSGAHVQKYAPLRSSGKPRQNTELRARVIGQRQLGAAASVAATVFVNSSESCPSGQREQAVNLPDLSYAGSNPALSTAPSVGFTDSPRFLPQGMNRGGSCYSGLGFVNAAGVAQLVERQPSKLNVESSSLFSRSQPSHGNVTSNAHLAQLVEHVLGKDEVISSILMVGSKQQ